MHGKFPHWNRKGRLCVRARSKNGPYIGYLMSWLFTNTAHSYFFLSPFKRSLNIKSTRHGVLSLLYLFYYFCFFFRSSPISTPRVTSGVIFFFKDPPSPRISTMTLTLLTSLPLHQLKPFVLAPKLKSTNQNPRFQTAQSELAQDTTTTDHEYCLQCFFPLYLVTQEEEIFGRVNEGVRVSLPFLFAWLPALIFCFVLPTANKC